MFFLDIFGLFDLIAGAIFFTGDYIITGLFITFLGGFLLFKGATSLIKIPIWIGPISFFGGIMDLIAGALMYFGSHPAWLSHAALVLSALLVLKGFMTVAFGLFAR